MESACGGHNSALVMRPEPGTHFESAKPSHLHCHTGQGIQPKPPNFCITPEGGAGNGLPRVGLQWCRALHFSCCTSTTDMWGRRYALRSWPWGMGVSISSTSLRQKRDEGDREGPSISQAKRDPMASVNPLDTLFEPATLATIWH